MGHWAARAGLIGALALLGCGGGRGGSGTTEEPWALGVLLADVAEPRQAQMRKDLESAASKEPRVKLLFRDAGNDPTIQKAQMREFLKQGVALIILNPVDSEQAASSSADAMAKGVPVIALDRKVAGDKCTCFIGSDNVRLGELAARQVVDLLDARGQVVELKGHPVPAVAQERHEGFLRGIRGTEVQIVYDVACGGLEGEARKEMAAALRLHPEIDAVFAHNDRAAHGAYLAAREEGRGRHRTLKFVGIDALPQEGVQFVKEGTLTVTLEHPTGGERAVQTALRILKGERVPETILLGTRLFTEATVERGGYRIE